MDTKDSKDLNNKDKKLIYNPIPSHTEDIAKAFLDAAFQVHTALGPGLLESVYEACVAYDLKLKSINVKSQVALPVVYKEMKIESGYRLDLLVDNSVIVKIKSSDTISPVYYAQLLTYLRLTDIPLGLLINFNVIHMRDGIKRIIN
jgi:GxxExxY protein